MKNKNQHAFCVCLGTLLIASIYGRTSTIPEAHNSAKENGLSFSPSGPASGTRQLLSKNRSFAFLPPYPSDSFQLFLRHIFLDLCDMREAMRGEIPDLLWPLGEPTWSPPPAASPVDLLPPPGSPTSPTAYALFGTLHPHQRAAHCPGSVFASNKLFLAEVIEEAKDLYGERLFEGVMPQTLKWPESGKEVVAAILGKKSFMLKSSVADRAEGLRLLDGVVLKKVMGVVVQEGDVVQKVVAALADFDLAQEYVDRPLLISSAVGTEGELSLGPLSEPTPRARKFGIRLFVLVASIVPLRIFVSSEENMFLQICTEKYNNDHGAEADSAMPNNTTSGINMNAHVCNPNLHPGLERYAAEKFGDRYFPIVDPYYLKSYPFYADISHLRNFSSSSSSSYPRLLRQIRFLLAKTFLALFQKQRIHLYSTLKDGRNCFEIFGVDLIVDEDWKPWLLEINAGPDLTGWFPEDHAGKVRLLRELATDVLWPTSSLQEEEEADAHHDPGGGGWRRHDDHWTWREQGVGAATPTTGRGESKADGVDGVGAATPTTGRGESRKARSGEEVLEKSTPSQQAAWDRVWPISRARGAALLGNADAVRDLERIAVGLVSPRRSSLSSGSASAVLSSGSSPEVVL